MRPLAPFLLAGAAFAVTAAPSHAQSIDPAEFETTLAVGESVTINKTISLGPAGATTVDVFFLADNTGSMGGEIAAAKTGASAILAGLPSGYRFGAASYFGDPTEGVDEDDAYTVNQGLTTNASAVQAGINSWVASGGGDYPEAGFFALEQTASGAGWRPEAQRLIVWFGDAPSQTETTSESDVIAALQDADVKLLAFNSEAEGTGLDHNEDSPFLSGPVTGPGQATRVVNAVGGNVTHNFESLLGGTGFVDIVEAEIEAATSTLDLFFASSYAGTGLDISFTCTDVLGCDDVEAGASRTFDVTITGLEPGTYEFEVFARGVDAVETDRITVIGDGVVATPEPGTMLLLGAGLLGLGFVGYRREDSASA